MTDLAKLVVRLEAQTAQYQKKLEKAEKRTKKFGKSVKKSIGGLSGVFSAVAIGAFTSKIIAATAKQEAAVKQLEQGLASTGQVVGLSLQQLTGHAAELQRATTFGDEDIIRAQSQLVTFTKITGDEFKRTTAIALDMSERFGTDVKSSVLQLGKALNDPVANLSALSRAGIQFSAEQKEVIKSLIESGNQAEAQRVILKELEVQFGGSAKAAGDTFGGALKGLSNDMGDLLEAKGGLPEATSNIIELRKVVSSPEFSSAFNDIASGIISAFAGVISYVPRVVNWLKTIGIELGFAVQSAVAAAQAIKEAVTLGDGIGFGEARDRFRARMESLRAIRDEMISGLATPAAEGVAGDASAVGATGEPVTGAVGAVGGIEPAANDGEIEAAAEKERAKLEAVAAVKEEFRVAEEEGKIERLALQDEADALRFESQIAQFSNAQTALTDILAQQTVNRLGIESKASKAQVGMISQTYGKGLSLLQTSGKKSEKLQKAMRIKEAVMATYSAAINSYNALAGIPIIGPALGAAAAIAATAFGLKQVKAIKSGGGAGGGSVSVPSASAISQPSGGINADVTEASSAPQREINVVINDSIDPTGTRRILDAVNEALGDGAQLNVEAA